MTPTLHRYYRGGPRIEPEWLVGRKLLVVDLTDPASVYVEIPDSDIHARKGEPMPDLDAPREWIVTVRTLAQGRLVDEVVRVWDGVEVLRAAP